VLSEESKINKVLRGVDPDLPRIVAALIAEDNHDYPCWEKNLLSSQLDMDRLDYLRRDSLFTGAGYGHFDWYRILNTFHLHGPMDMDRDLVWSEKSALAIEEYIFARFYMYWNVYLHKTTRGFEKLLEAMWRRARQFFQDGKDISLVGPISDFWRTEIPSIRQYLALEEFTVLSQIQVWTGHKDEALSDLARRFLERDRLAFVNAPAVESTFQNDLRAWEEALTALVKSRVAYDPPEMYCLRDNLKAKYSQPYFPEKESDEQGVSNAIRLKVDGQEEPVEISKLLPRLRPVTEKPPDKVRYYIPKELQKEAERLRREWK
jgi:HD superfamily phosphohydrolase